MSARTAFHLALAALPALLAAGCLPPQADYELGLGTTEIVGTVRVGETGPAEAGALIVVLKNHYKFIPIVERDDPLLRGGLESVRSITHPTAHLQRVPPSHRGNS